MSYLVFDALVLFSVVFVVGMIAGWAARKAASK